MKRLTGAASAFVLMLVTAGALCVLANNDYPLLSGKERERKILEYLAPLSYETERIRNGASSDPSVTVYADSAAHYMYEVSAPSHYATRADSLYAVYRPIILENYNILARDTVLNYDALGEAVKLAVRVERMHDQNLLTGALFMGNMMFMEKRYKEAAEYLDITMRTSGSMPGNDGMTLSLSTMGVPYYSLAGRNSDALGCAERVSEILTRYGMCESGEWKENLIEMISLNTDLGRYAAADSLMKLAEASIPETDDLYPELLSEGSVMYDSHDRREALRWMGKTLDYCERYPSTAPLLYQYLHLLGYLETDDSMIPRILAVGKRDLDMHSVPAACGYAKMLWLGRRYDESRKVAGMVESVGARKLAAGEDMFETLNALIDLHVSLGRYGDASALMDKNMGLVSEILRPHPELIAGMYDIQSSVSALSGDYRKSLALSEMQASDERVSEATRVKALISLGGTCAMMGDYDRSLAMTDSILSCHAQILTPYQKENLLIDKLGMLISLVDLQHDRVSGQAAGYKERFRDAVGALPPVETLSAPAQVVVWVSKASLAMLEGRREEMLDCLGRAERIIALGEGGNRKDTYSDMLALFYLNAGLPDRAVSLLDHLKGREYGRDEQVSRLYDDMIFAEACLAQGDTLESQKIYSSLCRRELDVLHRQFGRMTSEERSRFWRMHSRTISNAARYCRSGEQSDYTALLYDLALAGKGLMMETDNAFEHIVSRSDNEEALAALGLYRKLRSYLALTGITDYERKDAAAKMDSLELHMMAIVPETARLADGLADAGWKEIRSRLGQNDVAIEFVETEGPDLAREYAAVVVTRKAKKPVFVKIGREDSLMVRVRDGFGADMLWNPLIDYMHPEGNTYFVPAGVLNGLPVESLLSGGEPVSAKYPLYRLSTTRELLHPERKEGRRSLLFGNMDYDAVKEGTGEGDRNVAVSVKPTGEGMRSSVVREAGGGIAPLPSSAKEVQEIYGILDSFGKDVSLFEGVEASEATFRKEAGSEVGLLHIATHGYYMPSGRIDSGIPALSDLIGMSGRNADAGLLNSGLVMSGVNVERETADEDDSLLTALEISRMDFGNTELVVLSACESGRGDVDSFDVYGLQRGFKMAGAGALLISLRPVYDRETAELMADFYRNLSAGIGKREALEQAKGKLRSVNPDPAVWAPFILVDALE